MSEHRPHTLLVIEDRAGKWYWELEATNGTRVAQSMNAFANPGGAKTSATNLIGVPFEVVRVRYEGAR